MSDLAKEIANTVVRIKTEMRKASFASRSEAGRYAANQRWKGQGKQAKTADDGLSIRGMTPEKRALDELRVYAEEQRGLLDAMRGVASKAEIKQQIGLVNLADRDLRRMEQAQAKAEPPKSTHRAEYLKYRIGNKEGRDRAFSEANIMKAGKGLNEKYGAPLATKDDVAFAAQIKDELETAISPLEQEVRDVLGKLDANEGDRATNLKSLQRVKTKFAALARKSEKDAKASGNYANALEENTVRTMVSRTRTQIFDMASKDVGFVLDQEKAIDKGFQSRMDKAQFASRSEAGRYAANMRWKGQGKKGKGNTDTAQLIAYRQAGNTKDAKLTEQKIEQRLATEGKTSPAERMAAGLRDFKGKTAEPKGIKVDFRPEPPESTRNDVGDLSAAKNIVRKFENNLNSLKETTGIKGKRMKEWKAVCNLDGAKKAAKAATKEECAKVIRDYEEKGMKTYKEYEYANFRVKSGSQIGNNVVRQKMVAMRDNNEAYSRDAFDRAAGATEVFEARFGESISSYPESN